MSDRDDPPSVPFPNARVGTEHLGLHDCFNAAYQESCQNVQQMTLDYFVCTINVPEIDFLSVDAEGYKWPVLMGAINFTLPKVKYLEFEYHQVGRWGEYKLKPAIDTLQQKGFTCYWEGRMGKLWRITNCWMDYYNNDTFKAPALELDSTG
jgi:hypothetical protein